MTIIVNLLIIKTMVVQNHEVDSITRKIQIIILMLFEVLLVMLQSLDQLVVP